MAFEILNTLKTHYIRPAQTRLKAYLERTGQPHVRAAEEFVRTHKPVSEDFPVFYSTSRITQRAFDIGFGLLGAGFFAASFIPIAALVKLDSPGPLFYFQDREGERDRTITLIKYRSMNQGSGVAAEKIVSKADRRAWLSAYTERLGLVGKYLRSSGLDELPQFISILKGDMTLIGFRANSSAALDIELGETGWRELRKQARPALIDAALVLKGRYVTGQELAELEQYWAATYSASRNLSLLMRASLVILSGNLY
ncbi:MAG: sugar transferase [Candidatus Margulisbacteria bacterium]|nr:sugar transferase [Candidatus Margulisiibacteriota bacterium]